MILLCLYLIFQDQNLIADTARAADSFQLSTIFVSDWAVHSQTEFNFQMQLSRASGIKVSDGDYMTITLPSDTSAQWNTIADPICTVQNGGSFQLCEIISLKEAKITFNAQNNLVIAGSISNFINPHSNKQIFNVHVGLYSKRRFLITQDSNLSLRQFKPSKLSVSLKSSSNVIGEKDQKLTVEIKPETVMTAEGSVLITFPEYYQDAGQDTLITNTRPDPCSNTQAQVISCKLNQRLRTLTIRYKFTDGQDHSNQTTFLIGQFNNPIVRRQTGFDIMIFDEEEYVVAQAINLALEGISEPAKFKTWDFNYLDTAASGRLATHQIIIQSSMPIQRGCRFKILYPPEFKISNKLNSYSGSGFFRPIGGSIEVNKNYTENTVEIIACKQNFGQFTSGVIQLGLVMNQKFVKTTQSFKLYMTELTDVEYNNVYQKLEKDFIILDSQQRPGDMKGSMTARSLLVQTNTALTFTLRPSMDLSQQSYFIINMPNTLKFQGPSCTVKNMGGGFSKRMYCSRIQNQITLGNPFDFDFKVAQADVLTMTVEEFMNPTSVQDIGILQVISYDYDDNNQIRAIDMYETQNIKSISGEVIKLSEVEVQSNMTSLPDQTYIFHLKLTHSVPIGGFFRIQMENNLNNAVRITNPTSFQNNCKLVTQQGEQGLDCTSGENVDYLQFIDIKCTRTSFGDTGTEKNTELKLKISGLTNPRIRNELSFFKIFSLDSNFRAIDQNFETQPFTVMMSRLQPIRKVDIVMLNKTNGAITQYKISMVSSTLIKQKDFIRVTFPPEIKLPFELTCGHETKEIQRLSCIKLGKSTIQFQLEKLEEDLMSGAELVLSVDKVRNSVSLRPSTSFTNITIVDSVTSNEVSDYLGQVVVENKEMSILPVDSSFIKQSSYKTLEDSEVTLGFQTNNILPNTAAILVAVPKTLPMLYSEKASCYMKLNGKQVQDLCKFNGRDVIYQDGLTEYAEGFSGSIELYFKVQNPKDNQEISKVAFKISIYDRSDLLYGVDKLEGKLFPNIGCEYPCKDCLPGDKKYCTSCLPQLSAPQFLHRLGVDRQTCIDLCPPGFTSNGSKDPRKCTPCSPTCETCANNDEEGDINLCLECRQNFPYYWLDKSSCHANACPNESYLNSTRICSSCERPCKFCSDRLTCTKCEPMSGEPYLFDGWCLANCPRGNTPISNICTRCISPCATCEFGQVQSCTSCDNSGEKQFLYGKNCVAQCPAGTTLSLKKMECQGCEIGCALCDEEDNSICLRCTEGLSMFNNICVKVCPRNYLKSSDGLTCEMRTYIFDDTFIAFPFIGTALFFLCVTMASWWLTGRRSLIPSTMIAFLGPIEMAACLHMFIYSSDSTRNFIPIKIGSICCFSAGVVLNIVFFVNFQKQFKDKNVDKDFYRWRKRKWVASNFFIVLAALTSLTMYRLIYCRLFRLEMMSVRLSKPRQFFRPILIFSSLKILLFNIPLFCVDIFGTTYLTWGHQVFMTMIEHMILSFFSLILLIWEWRISSSMFNKELDPLNMDKFEFDKKGNQIGPSKIQTGVAPDQGGYTTLPDDSFSAYVKPAATKTNVPVTLSLNQIKNVLVNKATMEDIKEAQKRKIYPGSKDNQRKLAHVIRHIKQVAGQGLNNRIDDILDLQFNKEIEFNENDPKKRRILHRSFSCHNLKTKKHNQLNEGGTDKQFERDVLLYYNNEYDEFLIQKFYDDMEQERIDALQENNKMVQYEDPVQDNVYVSPRDPPPKIEVVDNMAQTEQDKIERDQERNELNKARDKIKGDYQDQIMMLERERWEEKMRKEKRSRPERIKRRGMKSFLNNAIEEEDDSDSNRPKDPQAENMVGTLYDQQNMDMLTLAMQVDQDRSLTDLYEMSEMEREKLQSMIGDSIGEGLLGDQLNNTGDNMAFMQNQAKGIDCSRVSGELFSDSDGSDIFRRDPQAKEAAQMLKRDNVQAWIKDTTDRLSVRTFNINEIIGRFERDWTGKVINRDYVLHRRQFKDLDGNIVNQKGYLIDPETGDIRSRYNFETVFPHYTLTGDNQSEIPLPYRLENHNFNPHECFGNFNYNRKNEPEIVQDKFRNLLDNNFRQVNRAGWLIDQEENVVDNRGHIKFIKAQLTEKGEIPGLFNFEGKQYKIKNIIGQFEKDRHSKEIILCQDPRREQYTSCDTTGHRVNSNGYLLDDKGNIINKKGKIIWRSHELMYNEPPKIFNFTQFSMSWIKGHCDRDPSIHKTRDEIYDLNKNRINIMGYLVDDQLNVIDSQKNNIVFKNNILSQVYGHVAEIPYIYRSGVLLAPDLDTIEREFREREAYGFKYKHEEDNEDQMDIDDEAVFQELKKMDSTMGPLRDGNLASLKDARGIIIEDIPQSPDQAAFNNFLPGAQNDYQEVQSPRFHKNQVTSKAPLRPMTAKLRNPVPVRVKNPQDQKTYSNNRSQSAIRPSDGPLSGSNKLQKNNFTNQ